MIAIDLGHRFGRVGRIGPDGLPDVVTTELDGTDGVLDPQRALSALLGAAPPGPDGRAVLGIPATGGGEDELRRAADGAGLAVDRVLPDPVAVALHYGAVAEGVDHAVLVCDQGATTLDLTLLAVSPDLTVHVVRTHSVRLGGDDWDAALAARLAGRLPDGADPRRAAGMLRRALGAADSVTEPVLDSAGAPHPVTLDRATFEEAVAPLRQRALAAVAEQLADAEPAVDTVLLAGGLNAAPGRRAEIEALPLARDLTVRCYLPELAVVRGLLALRDFGVLRVVTGSPRSANRADFGHFRADTAPPAAMTDPDTRTAPPAAVTDPDPLTWPPEPDDPEPETHPASTEAAPDAADAGHRNASPRGDGSPYGDGSARPDTSPAGNGSPAPHGEPGSAPGNTSEPRTSARQQPAAPPPESSPDTPPTTGPAATIPGPRQPPDLSPPSAPAAPPAAAPEPPPPPPHSAPPDGTGTPGEAPSLFAVPVGELQAVRRDDHLLVLWAWPEGALSARVRWRREDGSAGGGPKNGDVVCRRRVYEHDGGFDLAVGRGAVTLTVEALVPDLGGECEGASSLLVPAQPPVVEYEPTVRRRLKGRVATVTFTSETGCDLPGLRIVHSLGRFRPTSTAEGTVVHELPAQRLPAGTPLTVEVQLPATRGPSWLVCFPADANAGTDSGIEIRPTALHRLRVT
ncbi:Hsp70 family protein [Streptomyces sp. MN13]